MRMSSGMLPVGVGKGVKVIGQADTHIYIYSSLFGVCITFCKV